MFLANTVAGKHIGDMFLQVLQVNGNIRQLQHSNKQLAGFFRPKGVRVSQQHHALLNICILPFKALRDAKIRIGWLIPVMSGSDFPYLPVGCGKAAIIRTWVQL